MKKHHPDCNWRKANCEYKDTHHYCPHPEHACNCSSLDFESEKCDKCDIEVESYFQLPVTRNVILKAACKNCGYLYEGEVKIETINWQKRSNYQLSEKK